MRLPQWFENWLWRTPPPIPRPFERGMILQPGESAQLDIELPREVHEVMTEARERGEEVRFSHGAPRQIGPMLHACDVHLVASGRVLAHFEVTYEG